MVHLAVLQLDPEVPLDRFGPWLEAAGAECEIVECFAGQKVPAAVDVAGLLVLGGTMNAYDDARAPWLPEVRALLAEATVADVPILGICLGHQLLAVALGGRVAVGAPHPEHEPTEVSFTAAARSDAVFGVVLGPEEGEASVRWVNESHFDSVTDLPDGAVPLAHTAHHLQAFRIGRAYGVQFHPEASPELIRQWAEGSPGRDPEAACAAATLRDRDIADFGRRLAASFVALVRSAP